jgi:hypothetical protein
MIFGRSVPQRVCLIHDISDGGARLHIGLLLDPPERFALSLPPDGAFHRACSDFIRRGQTWRMLWQVFCCTSGTPHVFGWRCATMEQSMKVAETFDPLLDALIGPQLVWRSEFEVGIKFV